ncbi:putative nucleic acid-binding protein [Leptolyngbyaceae cyanobacterium JSC-12]|nr:putative nucleic acid-binding protein [Leptolyngbyaceae cyanobacterium JSC-12]
MILCDAGVLLCLVDRTQSQHNAYRTTVTGLAKPLITTWSCRTEAMYLALHRGGWTMQKQLGQLLLDKLLLIYEVQENDYARLLNLMEKYRDRPMDLADATLVLAAEKVGYRQILTLDSDFLLYRTGVTQLRKKGRCGRTKK